MPVQREAIVDTSSTVLLHGKRAQKGSGIRENRFDYRDEIVFCHPKGSNPHHRNCRLQELLSTDTLKRPSFTKPIDFPNEIGSSPTAIGSMRLNASIAVLAGNGHRLTDWRKVS